MTGMTMNDSAQRDSGGQGQAPKPKAKPRATGALSRIKLALLEQYTLAGEKAGGDPYNANTGGAAQDQWRGNSRRI
jgi:hypothetical protein